MGGAPATNAAPDWETLALKLECPRCGYDLRLLPQPRCPECGLQFDWAEILAAAEERIDNPLFEYQWRRRPLRSFVTTVGAALLPWRLWPKLRLAARPRVGPLLGMVVLLLFVRAACLLVASVSWFLLENARRVIFKPVSSILAQWWWSPEQIMVAEAWCVAFYLAVGLAVWLFVQIFQQTISKCRVRQGQILRVVVLSWTCLFAWALLADLVLFAALLVTTGGNGMLISLLEFKLLAELLSFVVALVSLCLGLGLYLKLRRGWLIGMTTAFTLCLGFLTAVLTVSVFYFGSYSNPLVAILDYSFPGLKFAIEQLLLRVT